MAAAPAFVFIDRIVSQGNIMRKLVNTASALALIAAQLALAAPAQAQTPMAVPVDKMARPTVQPVPVPVPLPVPVNPNRPRPPIQPVRPMPPIQPVRPMPPIQPVRPPRPPIIVPPPVYPGDGNWSGGNGGNWNGATIRCESQNYRYRECRADTRGGVRLVRVRGGRCIQGQTWGYRQDFIWVNNGCRADFQTRFGNYGGNNNNGGPSTGAVIGGVAVAAGLIALLAASDSNKNKAPQTGNPAPPQQPYNPPVGSNGAPARITANTGGVTPDARPSLNTCLTEAARQIGATGGTEIQLDRLDDIEKGNGGFRFRFQLKAVYPDETRTISTFCRATPTTLVELTFG